MGPLQGVARLQELPGFPWREESCYFMGLGEQVKPRVSLKKLHTKFGDCVFIAHNESHEEQSGEFDNSSDWICKMEMNRKRERKKGGGVAACPIC